MGGVEEILLAVVVGRGGDYHEICIAVGGLPVQSGSQIQVHFPEIFLDAVVLNRGNAAVDFLNLFRNHIHRRHFVVLRKKGRD